MITFNVGTISRRRKFFKVGTIYFRTTTNPSPSVIEELLEMDMLPHKKRECFEVVKRTKYFVFFKYLRNGFIFKRKSHFYEDDFYVETCHIANKSKLLPIKANCVFK